MAAAVALALAAACGGKDTHTIQGNGGTVDPNRMCELAWDNGGKDLAGGQSKADWVADCAAKVGTTGTGAP